METQGCKRTPAWSTQEVVDFIAVWGEESVQAQIRSSRRNTHIYTKITREMGEKGYTRDMQQCHVKIKDLHQVYQKAREVNSRSGSAPEPCRFYELHAIVGGNPTTAPKHSMDTTQESWVTLGNNKEDIVDKEDEDGTQASEGSILLNLWSNPFTGPVGGRA
ncbi:Zinc finger and SCAN domain-containing protein 29 [Chelonia mydas]|uniref:Zinc finger and SCAN domain-containing protein 29 n=1 Tax=Chelonia mydas TaxID=8469 RepID=M7B3Q1_CHEMY|nr:Zinc finger and SCAN domain-containing protein 29 [Chelonia mydas]